MYLSFGFTKVKTASSDWLRYKQVPKDGKSLLSDIYLKVSDLDMEPPETFNVGISFGTDDLTESIVELAVVEASTLGAQPIEHDGDCPENCKEHASCRNLEVNESSAPLSEEKTEDPPKKTRAPRRTKAQIEADNAAKETAKAEKIVAPKPVASTTGALLTIVNGGEPDTEEGIVDSPEAEEVFEEAELPEPGEEDASEGSQDTPVNGGDTSSGTTPTTRRRSRKISLTEDDDGDGEGETEEAPSLVTVTDLFDASQEFAAAHAFYLDYEGKNFFIDRGGNVYKQKEDGKYGSSQGHFRQVFSGQ